MGQYYIKYKEYENAYKNMNYFINYQKLNKDKA